MTTAYRYTMLLMLLLAGSVGNAASALGYATDMLHSMWTALGNPAEAPSAYRGHPLSVRVTDGTLQHLGYRIFSDEQRAAFGNDTWPDFVERYMLSLDLPLERQKSVERQMHEDGVNMVYGTRASLMRMAPDVPVRLAATQKTVSIAWGDDNAPRALLTFPIDHELLSGRKMLENDRRLPDEIRAYKAETASVVVDTALLVPHRDILMLPGAAYYDEALSSTRYYHTDSVHTTVFSTGYPVESLANLFTGTDVPEAANMPLTLRHIMFGFQDQPIVTTVQQWVGYCLAQGCEPYVGVLSIAGSPMQEADVLVVMHNPWLGYNHLLRVNLTHDKRGRVAFEGRLDAFVPSSNVKELFKD